MNKQWLLIGLMALTMSVSGGANVQAASMVPQNLDAVCTSADKTTISWVKKAGKYYLISASGEKVTTTGWYKADGEKYYLRHGARTEGWKTIDGKRYYFCKGGALYKETKFQTIEGKSYYFRKNGSVAVGLTKIGKKTYYFGAKGALQTNLRNVKIGKKYYNVDADGVVEKLSAKAVKCQIAAQKFIAKHAKGASTKKEKFRKCFYYLEAHMKYNAGYYHWSGDKKYFENKEGLYDLALETFNSPVLRGNCHRFAACVAAIAKELGYTPYVITTAGDHSFVVIDGKYYDNMGAQFGTSSHASYTLYKKQKM